MKENKLNIFLPIDAELTEKSNNNRNSDKDDNSVIVAGWASTPKFDFQGETVDPLGIDDSYFKDQGWIDYEHDKDNIIGYPTENTFTDSKRGLFVEAKLFKNNKYVKSLMDLINNLKETGSSRKLGFSIEGFINKRDENKPSIIRNIQITGIAVTKNPANPEATWETVQKSYYSGLTAGYGVTPDTQVDGGALKVESMLGSMNNISTMLSSADANPELFKQLGDQLANIIDDNQNSSPMLSQLYLQIFEGLSRDEAHDLLFKNESEE